jgi:hypothetical protein
MAESAEDLDNADLDDRTLEVQADIVRKLRELIDAFDVKLREGKQKSGQSGQGGQGGGGKPPLVPDTVQLNLMKKMQEDILRKTQKFSRGFNSEGADLTPSEKQILMRLSEEQGELGGIMKRFLEQFEQEKQEREKEERKREE